MITEVDPSPAPRLAPPSSTRRPPIALPAPVCDAACEAVPGVKFDEAQKNLDDEILESE